MEFGIVFKKLGSLDILVDLRSILGRCDLSTLLQEILGSLFDFGRSEDLANIDQSAVLERQTVVESGQSLAEFTFVELGK